MILFSPFTPTLLHLLPIIRTPGTSPLISYGFHWESQFPDQVMLPLAPLLLCNQTVSCGLKLPMIASLVSIFQILVPFLPAMSNPQTPACGFLIIFHVKSKFTDTRIGSQFSALSPPFFIVFLWSDAPATPPCFLLQSSP